MYGAGGAREEATAGEGCASLHPQEGDGKDDEADRGQCFDGPCGGDEDAHEDACQSAKRTLRASEMWITHGKVSP